jgi:hypothetical protein
VLSLANKVSNHAMIFADLKISVLSPTSFARRRPHPISSARIARSGLPGRLSDGLPGKVLD